MKNRHRLPDGLAPMCDSRFMNANPDRHRVLALAARVDVDPRTIRRHLRGERVLPAIARAIDAAIVTAREDEKR